MTKRKKKLGQGTTIWLTLFGLIDLGLITAALLRGNEVALFQPKGLIAREQHDLMIFAVALMLVIAIPVLALFYFFAWRYREANDIATYSPQDRLDKKFALGLWAIPSVFILTLATVMWPSTHNLEPHKPIASEAKPLTVQVVALRWKWLFIYPEHNIATVNFVQIPVGTPVQFELTADETPMSSFWIPHLGGQLYAMTGHTNRLNLMADTKGDYPGSSAEINGTGFAGMKFMARASSKEDFDLWAHSVQLSSIVLDSKSYKKLIEPSENNSIEYYKLTNTDLYDNVLVKYMGTNHGHEEQE